MSVKYGACNGCGPKFGNVICWGSITIPNLTINSDYYFASGATLPAGNYRVEMCVQAWCYNEASGPPGFWVITQVPTGAAGNADGQPFFTVSSDAGRLPFSDPVPGGSGFFSEAVANAASPCTAAQFTTSGAGQIKIMFEDWFLPDNIPGTFGPPTFILYQILSDFRIVGGSFTFTDSTHQSGTFSVLNNTSGTYSNVTFTVQSSGGISSPSSPVTVSFSPGQTVAIPFSWTVASPGKVDCVATILVTATGLTIPALTAELIPILVISLGGYGSGAICSGTFPGPYVLKEGFWGYIHNIGYGSTWNLVATVPHTGGIAATYTNDGTCVPASAYAFGQVAPGAAPMFNILFDRAAGVSPVTATVDLQDGTLLFPPGALSNP